MRSPLGATLPVAAVAAVLSLLACSSSTPSPQNPDDPGSSGEGGGKKPPSATASAHSDDGPQPFTANDRELTHRDCQVLGGRYRELVMSDEATKLDPSLTDSQREQGKEAITHGADILGGKWTDSCEGALVGKFATEESLRCAMSAKTVAAFDVCLNGPASPPSPSKK